jgi:hypothetical protein
VGDELLAGHHRDPPVWVLAVDLVPDGMKKVGLSEPDTPIEKQGIVF